MSAFNDIAPRYATAGGEFFSQIARHLVDAAGIKPGDRVLDVGCGAGAVTIPAAAVAGPDGHVFAIDISANMLARAGEATHGLFNVTLGPGDAHDPPFAAGAFQVVLASNVLVFLTEPTRALAAWHRLLAPGGVAAFSWGIAGDPRWSPVIAAVDAHVPPPHQGFEAWIRRHPFSTPEHVEAVLASCGYTGIHTTTREIATRFVSREEWWRSCLSSGPFAVSWRHIPPDELPHARQEAFTLLDNVRAPDGTIPRTLRYGFTTAIHCP
jgi:ubiquinone/menaquinone biosynthesis C-methylase UbiE